MSKVSMKQAKDRFTYEDYLLLPEEKRYEILDGGLCVVAAPNTRHQLVSMNREFALFQYVKSMSLGVLLHAPCDVILSKENIVQPDILFVSRERLDMMGEANIRGAPDLAIEILSPGSREKDLEVKRTIYARHGVQEYWIVDPDAATVEVLILSKRAYSSAGVFGKSERLSSPLLPDLNLPVSTVFPD